MSFQSALIKTLGLEGGFSDDPADSGGATNFGITEAVARAYGYEDRMDELPRSVAEGIYRQRYWDVLSLDDMPDLIAGELFDTAVNMGVAFAGRCLQRALNAFNHGGEDYDDLTVDGLVGQMTIVSLLGFLEYRLANGEKVLLRALNSLQGARYIELVERRPKDERFVWGWFLNRVE